MTKAQLRNQYRQQRQQLTPADKAARQAALLQQFMQAEWPKVTMLFSYYPIAAMHEVETAGFILQVQTANPGCGLAYPVSNFDTGQMEAVAYNAAAGLVLNDYGIAEPPGGEAVLPANIDMILVPLLAFDPRGHRVGYGKGFYDRFFARCRPNCLRVGLSFFDAAPFISNIGQIDVPLTHCITPTKVYVF
jgi:5-formyltetrahydrofolate cyclo-ligase